MPKYTKVATVTVQLPIKHCQNLERLAAKNSSSIQAELRQAAKGWLTIKRFSLTLNPPPIDYPVREIYDGTI